MRLIKEYIFENKKSLFIILVAVIILMVVFICFNNKTKLKIYASDNYVYIKDTYSYDEAFISELPYINIKGDDIKKINIELINEYYKVIEFGEQMMKYDYYINDNILSLIVKLYYLEAPDVQPDIYVYNVDIEEGRLLAKSDLLTIFNISNYDVTEIISGQLKDYYNYEIRNEYISKDCNYDCYLSDIYALPLDTYDLYVKDNTLYAYKNLILDVDFYYDVESGFNLFNFNIKKLNG